MLRINARPACLANFCLLKSAFCFGVAATLVIQSAPVGAQVVVQPQIIVEPEFNGNQVPLYPPSGQSQPVLQGQVQPVGQAGVLTVQSIYKSKKFTASKFNPKWEKTGAKFVQAKPSSEIKGGSDLVAIDPLNDDQSMLLSAAQMVPPGKSKSLSVADHQWANDRKLALVFTNTRKVWRHHSRGDYWLLNRDKGTLRQIGKQHPESSLMFAKFSPDGKKIAYVSQGDVFIESVETGTTKQLTKKSSPEIINGTSDWVYEEEFDLKDCIRWSPDSLKIAFWEFNTSEVQEFMMINNTDSRYPKLTKFKHTKAGETNSAVRIGVVDLNGEKTTWIKVDGDPRENYLARARWTGNNQLMMQYLNRLQNRNSVLLADTRTGETRELFSDTDSAWLDTNDTIIDVDGGKRFTWISEKSGWRQVYLVDASSGQMKLITPGQYDVIKLLRVTKDSVYFIASPEKPTDRYLYRVPINGGQLERLTPAKYKGWNQYDVAADGTVAVHTVSSFGQPPFVQTVKLPSHETIRKVSDNAKVRGELAKLPRIETNFFRVNVAGQSLDTWIMKPLNFDPSRKYPVIVYVYGEPWGTTVTNNWRGSRYLFHRMLCEQGYAVCSIDNRGTNVPRGSKFRKSIYGQVGVLASSDQAAAIQGIANHYPWIDSQRIGIYGWSGGGSMTLNALFRYPDLYKTGISIAAVPDMRYYDSIYQERYMGTPQGNPEGYKNGSPINFAKFLKGNLLIIHGTGDDNCHYQTFELLINELVKQDKPFTMMSYPNRSHSINEGPNTTVHLRKMMVDYFLKNLPAGPR